MSKVTVAPCAASYPLDRNPDDTVAWFDETLMNAKYGECRGSGVLTRQDDGWKIEQCNLTIPMPNELAAEFVERIRGREEKPPSGE